MHSCLIFDKHDQYFSLVYVFQYFIHQNMNMIYLYTVSFVSYLHIHTYLILAVYNAYYIHPYTTLPFVNLGSNVCITFYTPKSFHFRLILAYI